MKAVYTICTPSHMAEAKTLIASVLQHNPETAGYIFLFNADAAARQELAAFSMANTLLTDDLQLEHYGEMKARYTAFELSCALKPYLADYLLHHEGFEQVAYFDADIMVLHSLQPVWEGLAQKDLILTGHINGETIWPDDAIAGKARRAIERNMLRGGIFNGGFFAVRKSPGSAKFLAWWKRVLLDGGYNKPSKGLFVDQLWLAMAPVLFGDVLLISKHPGFNMAYWNLDERKLSVRDGHYRVTGADGTEGPLVFFHFSGYKPAEAQHISVYNPGQYTFRSRPELIPLFDQYKKHLLQHGVEAAKARYAPQRKGWKQLFRLGKS